MKADDTKLDEWIRRRRGEMAGSDGIADVVLERIRGVSEEAESGGRGGLPNWLPRPALAFACLIAGAGKIWIALKLAF